MLSLAKVKTNLIGLAMALAMVMGLQYSTALAQDFPDVCQESGNVLPNCDFNNGLDGWMPYLEGGSANVSVLQGGGECHAPLCPAAYIVTEDHFVGGIYRQVPVATGNTYYANIVWLAFDSLANDASINSVVGGIGRRIGIDPFGGTDSKSENVIWSEDNWRNDCKICNVEQVIATAQADTITVFIRIDDTWRLRAAEKGFSVPPSKDQFWLDDIGMKQVDGNAVPQAQPTEPAPTDTPEPPPPTDTPESVPPTATPEPPTDTPTPAEVAQEGSTESAEVEPVSPVATPTPAKIVAPPPTLTPSPTYSPTPTPAERPTPTRTRRPQNETTPAEEPPAALSAELLSVVGTTACAGGLILLILGAVMAGLVWLYRLGWGNNSDDEYEDDIDDADEIIIDIDG